MRDVTVNELLMRWEWKPLRHCPGRFVLITHGTPVSLETLIGDDFRAHRFTNSTARDPVIVVPLEEGGLISYARRDGSVIHTLNTPSGFARKLAQLGINLLAGKAED